MIYEQKTLRSVYIKKAFTSFALIDVSAPAGLEGVHKWKCLRSIHQTELSSYTSYWSYRGRTGQLSKNGFSANVTVTKHVNRGKQPFVRLSKV